MWTNVIPLDFKSILRCFIEIKGIIGKIPPFLFLVSYVVLHELIFQKNWGDASPREPVGYLITL